MAIRNIKYVCVAFFFFIFTVGACHSAAPLRFSKFHSSLLREHWSPYALQKGEIAEYFGDTEERRLKSKFPGLESCSVDAGMLCRFWYKKGQQCLLVVTRGERLQYMEVVFRKRSECPV